MNIQNTLTVNTACFRNLRLAIYGCFVWGERCWMVVVIVVVVVVMGGGVVWEGHKEMTICGQERRKDRKVVAS